MQARGVGISLLLALAVVTVGSWFYGCSDSGGSATGPVDGARAMTYVEAMVKLNARPSGSASLLKCRDQIKAHLESIPLKVFEQEWWETDSVQKKKIRMHNVWTEIPGDDPVNGPILMLCAHYDTKLCKGHPEVAGEERNFEFVGAIDGAGGSAVLMELATHLAKRKNDPNIWILWVDGEESIPWTWNKDNTQALHGSKHFVEVMSKDKKRFPKGLGARIKAFVLIDLIGSKNYKFDKDLASNSQLNAIFSKAAEQMGEQKRMNSNPSEMTDDHIPFRNQGVKVIDLIDFHFRQPKGARHPDYQAWWHTAEDNLEAMDPAALAFTGNLIWTALPILEKEIFKMTPKDQK